MKCLPVKIVSVLALLFFAGTASANDSIWFGVKAGTLGLGAEVSYRPIEWLDVRAGANMYDYDDNQSYAGIGYDGTLALETFYMTGNFRFPLSPFRLTVGAYQNNNELQLVSQDMAAYPIGDNPIPYTPADVGTLRTVASFDGVSPYVGAGFDFDIMDRLGLALDFGVLWQGEPQVAMTADGLLASDPAFLADLENERLLVQDEMKDLKAYPVISLGLNFNFF
jgi:hypothetical protein